MKNIYFPAQFHLLVLYFLAVITLAGVKPAISADDERYNNLQGRQRQLWLDLLYRLSTENTIIGASRHLLYIGRKK